MKLKIAALLCALLAAASGAQAQDQIREESVAFPAGQTGTRLSGTITGYDAVSYMIGAEAGQRMVLGLDASNNQTFFTVFGPGQAPGGAGLAASDLTGPMVPEINRFDATLDTSGYYRVLVYQMRNAARQGLSASYTLDIAVTGTTGAIVEGDFADGLAGGPDYYAVRTAMPGGSLNIRQSASAGAEILGQAANGAQLRNLGCRMAEGRRWCRVATLSDPGLEGWAAGEFLIEGSGPTEPDMTPLPAEQDAMVPGTAFHATGPLPCQRDGMAAECTFGVIRAGNGNGRVVISWPDGSSREITFAGGLPTASNADAPMIVTRESDRTILTIGPEFYDIRDAVIWGG
ncbi:SH3 domain-containing protein [Sedimentimonas flavescens]|uniref:SH3 domain-containing protein n=1 Tax=Sedimentimonas flavescens TaxID=2851012 RepID=A0ABT2ZVK8_9RHOB|nr:SH3 domain-containing protein [Sedimentimonas flavescens]MCV2877789.1 SH3 domain-containing protein [Sedimentimonas flavescens]